MAFIIGIDTGGTCTDGVLMEEESGKIVATVKRPTTHQDLAQGTHNALTALLTENNISPTSIKKIAVSSTLATNSVVENKGADVALLVIGYVKHFKLPVKAVVFIKGGHTITGAEEEPLDIEYLANIVQGLKKEVDAYGVCSAMAMKNPSHELVAEKAISLIDPGKPVFSSHQISDIAGMEGRAATAGLHAKLMPVMQAYVEGVQTAMRDNKIDCPMHVIAGNTTLVSPEHIVRHAALTIASGPACTAHFGSLQTTDDALVVDVGGTTTDIAMINAGEPKINKEGCQIGSWRTHVEAVDMHTGGIGGDSHVQIDAQNKIVVGPIRVTPLAMAENSGTLGGWLGREDKSKLVIAQTDEETKSEVLRFVQKNSATPQQISEATKYSGVTLEREIGKLEKDQHISECGFTPTDALNVLEKTQLGNRDKSREAATILGEILGITAEEFAQKVLDETTRQIENLLIDYVVQHFYGKGLTKFISERNNHPMLSIDFGIKVPLVGIGAAAEHLLPGVAKNLGTEVIFPQHCAVGNAIGAAHLAQQG